MLGQQTDAQRAAAQQKATSSPAAEPKTAPTPRIETAELHRAGKVRIIGVTGSKRDPQVPEVPTLQEQGVDMVATAWFAMYGPAGLKPEVRDMLSATVARAIKTPALRAKLIEQGYEPVGSTSAELAAAQAADLKRWEGPIKATGVQLD